MLAILIHALFAIALPPTLAVPHRHHQSTLTRRRPLSAHQHAKRLLGGEFIDEDSSSSSSVRPTLHQAHAGFLQWDPFLTSSAVSSIFASPSTPLIPSTSSAVSSTTTKGRVSVAPNLINVIMMGSGVAGGGQATYASTTTSTTAAPPPTSAATATSTAAAPPQNIGSTGDIGQWLGAHNAARAQYHVGDLTWSGDLSVKAQGNAELCTHGHT